MTADGVDYEGFLDDEYQAILMEPFIDFLVTAYGKKDSTSGRKKAKLMNCFQIRQRMRHDHLPRKLRTRTTMRKRMKTRMRKLNEKAMSKRRCHECPTMSADMRQISSEIKV